jgi:hypothetical protein
LQSGDNSMKGMTPGGGGKIEEDEYEWLTKIIKVLNDTYGLDLKDEDKVEFERMKSNIYSNEGLMSFFNKNNSKDNIQEKFNEEIDNELLNFINTKLEFYNKLTEDKVNAMFKSLWFNELYDQKVRKGEKGQVDNNVDRLEVLPKLKERFGDQINPAIKSLKVCQDSYVVFTETSFADTTHGPVREDLDFIGDEEDNLDSILFKPENDIVDNANVFIELDQYTLYMSVNDLFTKDAEKDIKKQVNT